MVISDLTDSCIEKDFVQVTLNDQLKRQLEELKPTKILTDNTDIIEYYDDDFGDQLLICIRGIDIINAIHFQGDRVRFYDISDFEYYLRTNSSKITLKKIYLCNNDPFSTQKQNNKSKDQNDEYQDYSYKNLLLSFLLASLYSPNLKTITIDNSSNANIQGLKNLEEICCRRKSIHIDCKNSPTCDEQSSWSIAYAYEGGEI